MTQPPATVPAGAGPATETLHGVNALAVIDAIKARAARWRTGDRREDGRKIALVIEGGAMRATCSGGGAVALAQLGYSDLFDEVFATSAGVMNASYLLSNQPLLGITVYFDSCASRKFVNPLRVWKVLDVDYIFDRVVTIDKPLDVARVLGSRSKFFVAVIDKNTGEGLLIDTRTTSAPLLRVLKAATAMPVFYNRTVEIDGRPCMDGGLAIPFPLEQAIARGATDVLVLLTREAHYESRPPAWWSRLLFKLICARGNAAMNRTFAHRHEPSLRARNLALGRINPPHPNVNIATLCLSPAEAIARMSTDRPALHAAAQSYGRRVMRVFGEDGDAWSLPPLAPRPR